MQMVIVINDMIFQYLKRYDNKCINNVNPCIELIY